MKTNDKVNDLDALIAATTDQPEEPAKKVNWAGFVETTAVNFFVECKLEKLSMEDGKGNKAKLIRQRDDTIKVEYTSTSVL